MIENREALLTYDADPKATLQFLRDRLHLQFTHEQEARLAGARLAARTAHHLLNTPLSLALGYGELLAEDPRLQDELRSMAREAEL